MKIIIEIDKSEIEIKKAIAKSWNSRFSDELTHKDISEVKVSSKENILTAIPFLDWDGITIEVEK
jgi:hypothetical protein